MSKNFCTEALEQAITNYGRPEIFNTDQGSQFTSEEFTGILKAISMDGKVRSMDNVFIERLWRLVKCEHAYLHSYDSFADLGQGLKTHFNFFNQELTYQSLFRQTPDWVYFADRLRKVSCTQPTTTHQLSFLWTCFTELIHLTRQRFRGVLGA